MAHVGQSEIRRTAEAILGALGAKPEAAALQADWLVEAELRGHASHGIQRLPVLVRRIEQGLLRPEANPITAWKSTGVLQIDGDRGFGPVVANFGLDMAIDRAHEVGLVLLAISNASHLGILAPYMERIADEGIVAFASTTSEALVHPWGGRTAMIGTNPLAIGVPAKPHNFIVDMSTGEVSMGKILNYKSRGAALDPRWAIDAEGNPTSDPEAALSGAISPFGGAKGYALGLALELLVASLTLSALGTDVHGTLDTERVCNKGDIFLCVDPALVGARSRNAVTADISSYLADLRSVTPQPGFDGVRIPGDRARQDRQRRIAEGIDLPDALWADLNRLAEAKGVQ